MPQKTNPQPRPQLQPQMPLMSGEDASRIITQGDAELLVKKASELANRSQVSASQLRRIFGEVRRIEMAWSGGQESAASRRLILLKPRMRYQAARERKGLVELEPVLSQLIDQVGGRRERFQNFVEFLEAVVAYAKAVE